MGFPAGRIEAAIKHTNGTLEEAIEWLEQHQLQDDKAETEDAEALDEPETADIDETTTSESATNPSEPPRPLTQEEKDAKLNELREKAAKRKAEQEKLNKENDRKNDQIRKKRDQESAKAIDDMKRKEAMREAEKKRKEAREDAIAKQRIRDRIAADKEARRKEKDATKAAPVPAAPVAAANPPPARSAPTESKIRFRVQGQPPTAGFMKTYPVETTLGEVAESISSEVGISASSVAFQTTFPTKTFGPSEFSKTLKETDLINTNLIVKSA